MGFKSQQKNLTFSDFEKSFKGKKNRNLAKYGKNYFLETCRINPLEGLSTRAKERGE